MRVSAVIAAAGLSSRMHEFKPMMCIGKETMIESVVKGLRDANVLEIVVVTGYKSDILSKHLETLGVRAVENLQFAQTQMFDSLCLGIKALKNAYDAVFLMPGDVPLVQPKTLRAMMQVNKKIVSPVFKGQSGHPILLAAECVEAVLTYQGQGGLKGALTHIGEPVWQMEVNDEGVIMDTDTREDFKALLRQKMKIQGKSQLWPDIRINIAKGDVIFTSEVIQLLEMIGHIGSIQNACICMHMSYSKGWRLLNQMENVLGYRLIERNTGGANGGGSELTPKGRAVLSSYQTFQKRLQAVSKELFEEIFASL